MSSKALTFCSSLTIIIKQNHFQTLHLTVCPLSLYGSALQLTLKSGNIMPSHTTFIPGSEYLRAIWTKYKLFFGFFSTSRLVIANILYVMKNIPFTKTDTRAKC